jgi:hypothetical protein
MTAMTQSLLVGWIRGREDFWHKTKENEYTLIIVLPYDRVHCLSTSHGCLFAHEGHRRPERKTRSLGNVGQYCLLYMML